MYSSRLRQREKPLSQMTKAEKEQRARAMNVEYGKTATTNAPKYNKKARGGMKTRGGKSTAATGKGRRAGNTSDSFQCTPTSTSKKCRPGGK